ncbi:MAG: LysR family transcriptional regulator [Pseudomonadales bacterium]
MDTELARTFLAVVAAGNFSLASSRLYITQSTVSARIATLEDQLGCRLFVRNKAGTRLTAAGHRFQSYATTLVRTVERARQDIGIVRGFRASLTIGGRFGLWEDLLLQSLPRIRSRIGEVAVRAEIGFEDDLMQGLMEARTDLAVMYAPQRRPGIVIEPLLEERLVYVSAVRDEGELPGEGYVYVDWGPDFARDHNAAFPAFVGPAMSVNVGWLGIRHIVAYGGSGYFPLRMVRDELVSGRLHRRPDAPEFVLPGFLVHLADMDPETAGVAAEVIREVAAEAVRGA